MYLYYYKLTVKEYTIYLYLSSTREKDSIEEARHRGEPLGGPYSVRRDPPHSGGQYHLHIYNKNKQLFAINKDGTAHDQSHGCRIPNKVANALRKKFPDYHIPNNNFIESTSLAEVLIEKVLAFPHS